VEHAGFNLHAGVCVAGDDRVALERLCRYVARPAVCGERVEQLEDGRVAYRLKHPRQGGETHRVMTGQEFMARLVALIPPPRSPLVRYHGVFAPHSPWRAVVVPGPRRPHHRDAVQAVGCGHDGTVVARGEGEALTGAVDPLLACDRALELTSLVMCTAGPVGLYLAGFTDDEVKRETRYPLLPGAIPEFNRYEFSRPMRRADCARPLRVYAYIAPYHGGPTRITSTNGAGDAA
jgi:hypothetical protein